ncbi:MAG TPA: hypothetical protein VGO62_07035, partial [Myxococcota bacterium]
FTSSAFTGGDVGVSSDDGRGIALVDAEPGRLWLPLAPPLVAATAAAGFRAQVLAAVGASGTVDLGLALPPVARVNDATLDNLVGGPFSGALNIQIIGDIPLNLPASSTMDATLPLTGAQTIKQDAFDTAPAGPQSALCLAGQFDQQLLFNVAFGADPTEVALDFAALAEGMGASLAPAGVLVPQPLVVDADDVDGDGDTAELVPDYNNFAELQVQAGAPPLERIGIVTSAPPQGTNARAFAVCGVELPSGFVPLGVATMSGSDAGEQLKVVAASAAVAGAPRACTVHAVTADDSTASFVVVRASSSFAPAFDAGALLALPAGAFVLNDVPSPGSNSVVVPGEPDADALAVTVFDGAVTWQVIASSSGSVALPAYVDPVVLAGTTAYRLGEPAGEALGAGAVRALDDVAAAVATSP